MNDTIYCNEDLDINGTASDLYKEVRNGYRTKTKEIEKIAEICQNEGLALESLYCLFEIEAINTKDAVCNIAAIKQDYLQDLIDNPKRSYPLFYVDDRELGDNLYLTIEETTDGNLAVSIRNYETDAINGVRLSKDDFLNLTQDDFEKLTNEMNFYAMADEKDL